jgi:hypothetical protein
VDAIDEEKRIPTVRFTTQLNKLQAMDPSFTKELSEHLSMGIYMWEEYSLKAVRVLQILHTCSHELILAY